MANLERGAYEPRVDNIHAFDATQDEAETEEGSRLPLLIVIALVVLAAFAGVVWLAYTQGVERGRADAPRIVAAQDMTTKSGQSSYTGLKIYQPAASTDAETNQAGNAPPPAMPTLRPSANGVVEAPAVAPDVPPPSVKPPASTPMDTVAAPAPMPPATHAPAQLEKPVSPPEASSDSSENPPPAAAPAVAAPAVAAPPPAPVRGVLLQIGAYKSEAEANQSWRAFQTRHPIAAGYRPDVKKVDLGDKGTWYRLRIGSFADKQSAGTLCGRLRSDGASCLIAK